MVQSQPVQAFMTTPVKFVRPDTALTDVIQMLNAAHISGLAVCDGQGRLVGGNQHQGSDGAGKAAWSPAPTWSSWIA